MQNLNELTLDDLYAMHEETGITFVVEDGQIKGAYVPAVQ